MLEGGLFPLVSVCHQLKAMGCKGYTVRRGHEGRSRWAVAVGSFGYVGFWPVAPGTAASAVAALLYYVLPQLQRLFPLMAASLVLFAVGMISAEIIVRDGPEADPGFIVSDEVVGQWIALLSPIYPGNLAFVLVSFFVFRLFDIVKPFPASWLNRRRGGFYVMMDDVAAGIYANLATHLFLSMASVALF